MTQSIGGAEKRFSCHLEALSAEDDNGNPNFWYALENREGVTICEGAVKIVDDSRYQI